ncbi:predicted amidohydrolase [Bacteroidales bacterium 6E]|nr:predicted amidohydrolase [Bacteroidales bacterium 6E]
MSDLKVSILQPDPVWEDKKANLGLYDRMIGDLNSPDLILLPEMFDTGFSMNVSRLAEPMGGPVVSWMREKAFLTGAVVAGSTIIREGDSIFNRLVWAQPDGTLDFYHKRHLFSMGSEHLHYSPGTERRSFTCKDWKVRALVCYDLRFPVWSRNDDDYDLLVYLANWPSARHHVWKSLLVARALENQCWCIGVNRTGRDGMDLDYLGDSGVIDARGKAYWSGADQGVLEYSLSLSDLHEFRKKFPVLKDRDNFTLLP